MNSLRRLKSQWDRVTAIVLTLSGALILILGYFGVSRQGLAAEQIPYIVSGGLGGIFLMGVGAALWLSADLRDEWNKLDRIENVLEVGLERLGLGRGFDNQPTIAPLVHDDGSDSAGVSITRLEDPRILETVGSAGHSLSRRASGGTPTKDDSNGGCRSESEYETGAHP